MDVPARVRALLILLFVLPACATTEVRYHATSTSYSPSPKTGPIDIYIRHAPAVPYRVVGLIVVTPKYDLAQAARVAASTARSIGCDLLTMRRDGEVASAARPRILIASIGSWGSFGSDEDRWGSGGSRGNSSSGYTGPAAPEDPIDPRMRKFWCGLYLTADGSLKY
jgi:hypothetical protein